ncbi:MAG: trypsin-like serine protease [Clostridia bacterium]|nr:trypsin-like serine protease [Clostridia bacterium]
MKKFICLIVAAMLSVTLFFCGCVDESNTPLNVTVNNSYLNMTDDQWREYMEKLTENGDTAQKQQAAISRSLLCGVSILTRFEYKTTGYVKQTSLGWGSSGLKRVGTQAYHRIYCGAGVIVQLDKTTGDAYIVTNCHVVYDDTSSSVTAEEVYLYLYGQDTEGENYEIGAKYCTYGGKTVFDSSGEALVDYDIKGITDDTKNTGYEKYCISAEVIGASVTYDIALLKVSGSDALRSGTAMVAEFAESDDVYAGQPVYAVGNPEGDGMSVTSGVISRESELIELNLSDKDEDAYLDYRVIRTDAAINGGNSGGGMYNSDGELVGIINSKSVSEEIDNMGYALPGSNVKRLWLLMKDAYESGSSYFSASNPYIKRAVFPAEYKVASSSARLENGYTVITQTLVVDKAAGGFQVGDVLKNIKITDASGTVKEDRAITRSYHVEDTLLSARDGYSVVFTVQRGGEDTQVSFTATTSKV